MFHSSSYYLHYLLLQQTPQQFAILPPAYWGLPENWPLNEISKNELFKHRFKLNSSWPADAAKCRVAHITLMHRTHSFARAPPRGSFRSRPPDEAGTWPLPTGEVGEWPTAGRHWSRRLGRVTLSRDNVALSTSRWNTAYNTPTAWYKSAGRSYDNRPCRHH